MYIRPPEKAFQQKFPRHLPDFSFIDDLESAFVHLLMLAEDYNLDMASIINFTNEVGSSVFHRATQYSMNSAIELLKRNVKVNRITECFVPTYLKFEQLQQEMINRGANPFIQDFEERKQIDIWKLDLSSLENLPSIKSIYFPIKKFDSGNLGLPWCYTTGVYPGKYGQVIGKGSEGIVIQGKWSGQLVAYKFVPYKKHKEDFSDDMLAEMNVKLREMTDMQSTPGSSVMKIISHFR